MNNNIDNRKALYIIILSSFFVNIDTFYRFLYPIGQELFGDKPTSFYSIFYSQIGIQMSQFAFYFLTTVIMGVLSYTLYNNFLIKGHSKTGRITIISLVLLVLVLIFTNIDVKIFLDFEEDQTVGIHTFRRMVWYGARAINMTIISVYISNLIFAKQRQQTQENDLRELEIENYKNKFDLLKGQINPHFLFNSINTLNALIVKDPEIACRFVTKLSEFLNYSTSDKNISTVAEELEIAKSYAYLTYLRYGDAIKFNFEIDERIFKRLLPIFSIQILLENAVKHNIISEKMPLHIQITTLGESFIQVSNPICKKKYISDSPGTGLFNLSQRYILTSKKEIEISTEQENFTVKLPLI